MQYYVEDQKLELDWCTNNRDLLSYRKEMETHTNTQTNAQIQTQTEIDTLPIKDKGSSK